MSNQGECRMLSKSYRAALKEDRICNVSRVGEEIESLVAIDQLREAWSKTKRWYQESKGHRSLTTSEQLEQTSTLR